MKKKGLVGDGLLHLARMTTPLAPGVWRRTPRFVEVEPLPLPATFDLSDHPARLTAHQAKELLGRPVTSE